MEPDEDLYCETEGCPMANVPISNPFGFTGITCGTCGAPLHEPEPEPEPEPKALPEPTDAESTEPEP